MIWGTSCHQKTPGGVDLCTACPQHDFPALQLFPADSIQQHGVVERGVVRHMPSPHSTGMQQGPQADESTSNRFMSNGLARVQYTTRCSICVATFLTVNRAFVMGSLSNVDVIGQWLMAWHPRCLAVAACMALKAAWLWHGTKLQQALLRRQAFSNTAVCLSPDGPVLSCCWRSTAQITLLQRCSQLAGQACPQVTLIATTAVLQFKKRPALGLV